MKFALFYEIPVARPWNAESEYLAYQHTLEQAILGDKMGFHSFWTVEHHFLEEYSHCSNPEVLYGAIAARTKNIRLGYGVRLLPKPYNHPIRTAESVAVLDLISDGRVDFGTGRSSTRAELEGFDIDPDETREQWREALEHIAHRCLLAPGLLTSSACLASGSLPDTAQRVPQKFTCARPSSRFSAARSVTALELPAPPSNVVRSKISEMRTLRRRIHPAPTPNELASRALFDGSA
jgi:hypothetical protein